MTHPISRVKEFHLAFHHPVAARPTPATRSQRELRVKLIAEELAELCVALGVDLNLSVCNADNPRGVFFTARAIGDDSTVDLVETADALGDLSYVVQGANLVFGLPAEAVDEEIHRSNMSKLGADGSPIHRADGKVVKGPSYRPPDIARLIAEAHGIVDRDFNAESEGEPE